jgi:hypothetical protein
MFYPSSGKADYPVLYPVSTGQPDSLAVTSPLAGIPVDHYHYPPAHLLPAKNEKMRLCGFF